MSLTITSTTDSDTDVKAALGNQHKLGDKPQASEAKVEETEVKEAKTAAVDSEPAEGEAGKTAEPGKVEDKSNLDKRFAKLTKQRKELEARIADEARQRAYWENEAKRYRDSGKPEPKVETKTNEPAKTDGPPKQDDFENYQDYVEAKMDWKLKQAEVAREQKASEQATKAARDNLWNNYKSKEAEFIKQKPDFAERVEAIREMGITMSPIVESRIIESASPELAYELMKDPEEFKALCAMSANDALEHIGVIRAQLKAGSSTNLKEEKVVEVKQPKPVSPVGSRVTVIKDPEKMSIKEYDAWRRAGNSPVG